MKRILILFALLSFSALGQVDETFLNDAYLINSNPFTPRPLEPGDRQYAQDRPGNLIYKSGDGSFHYSNGSGWTKLWGEFIQRQYYISQKSDFPTAVNGVITLEDSAAYIITAPVDLTGDRLVCGANSCLLGTSSENSFLTSTGLSGNYLVTSDFTLPIRHITFHDVGKAIGLNVNNTGARPIAIDWTGVNFVGCDTNIFIGKISNFIFNKGAILGSGTIIINDSIETFGIENSLFTGSGSAYDIFEVKASAVVTRRFRIIYSSIVAFGSTVGIDFNSSSEVPTEGYILDFVNFSGGGTYLSGFTFSDNEALFTRNTGVNNSADVSQYYMNGNATATTVSATGTEYKVAGTTTSSSVTQKFTNTDNRATYNGALNRFFKVTAALSVSSGNNNEIGVYIAKNGVIIADSEIYGTTNSGGRAESIVVQSLVQLTSGDYIEIFVENNTATTNITVTDLNVIIE